MPTPFIQEMMDRAANQGKPGYDIFGDPVAGIPLAGGGAASQESITRGHLTPATPIVVPPPALDTTNHNAIIAGGQEMIDQNTKALFGAGGEYDQIAKLLGDNQPKSLETAYNAAYGMSGIDVAQQEALNKQNTVRSAQAKLAGIQAQIQGVVSRRDAENLRLEQTINQGTTGVGGAGGIAPSSFLNVRQQEVSRRAAIEALPLQAQALAAQAEVAGAQGNAEYAQSTLKMAQDKLNTAFDLKKADATAQYNYKKDLQDKIWNYLTDKEKTRLATLQKADDKKFTEQQANINDVHNAAQTLMAAGQGELAAKMWKLDEKSPTFKQDFAALQAQAKATTAIGVKTTMGVDLTGLPTSFSNAIQAGKTGSDLLNSLPALDKATLQSILDYGKNPANLSLRKSAGESQSEREKFLSMAHLIDPTYDETQYGTRSAIKKDFNSGKSAQNIRSLNTAVGHLQTLSDAGTKLENASLPVWNKIANLGITAVGDSRVVAFNTAATAVESELASVFKGMGATDQEIKAWRENINSSQSPAQMKGAIDTAIELMGSRLQALTNQYEIGIGKPKDFRILSNNSRQILEGLGVDVNALDPMKTAQEGMQNTAKGQTTVINGHTYVSDGTQWVLQ